MSGEPRRQACESVANGPAVVLPTAGRHPAPSPPGRGLVRANVVRPSCLRPAPLSGVSGPLLLRPAGPIAPARRTLALTRPAPPATSPGGRGEMRQRALLEPPPICPRPRGRTSLRVEIRPAPSTFNSPVLSSSGRTPLEARTLNLLSSPRTAGASAAPVDRCVARSQAAGRAGGHGVHRLPAAGRARRGHRAAVGSRRRVARHGPHARPVRGHRHVDHDRVPPPVHPPGVQGRAGRPWGARRGRVHVGPGPDPRVVRHPPRAPQALRPPRRPALPAPAHGDGPAGS